LSGGRVGYQGSECLGLRQLNLAVTALVLNEQLAALKPAGLLRRILGLGRESELFVECDACGLVVYNSKYLFKSFSPTPVEYRSVINPMIRRWNKNATLTLKEKT
jgi:hypothetical protein